MEKKYILLSILLFTFIAGVFALDTIYKKLNKNNPIGFVIIELNKSSPSVFGALIVSLILIVATLAYFYSANKFGPA